MDTGDPGRDTAGPRTDAGVVVVQTGVTSAAVGAGGPPAIWGPVEAPEWYHKATKDEATRTSVVTATAKKAFPDGNLPDAC